MAMTMEVENEHVAIIGGMSVLVTLVMVLLICIKKKGRASTTPDIPRVSNPEASSPPYVRNASYNTATETRTSYASTPTSTNRPRARADLPNSTKGVVEYSTSDRARADLPNRTKGVAEYSTSGHASNFGEVVYDATPAQVRDASGRQQLETQPVYAVSTKVDQKKTPKQPPGYAVVKPKRHTQFEKDGGITTTPTATSSTNNDDDDDNYASIDTVMAKHLNDDIDLSNYGDIVDAVGYASIKNNSNLHTEYASSNHSSTITSAPDYATVEDVINDTYATPTKRPTKRKGNVKDKTTAPVPQRKGNVKDKTTAPVPQPPVPTSSTAKGRLVLNLNTGESEFMSPLDGGPRPVSRYAIAKEAPTTTPQHPKVQYATSVPVRAPQPQPQPQLTTTTTPVSIDTYSLPNRINVKQKSIAVKVRPPSSSSGKQSMEGITRPVYKTKHEEEGASGVIDEDDDDNDEDHTEDETKDTYEDPQDIAHFYDVSREAAEKLVVKAGVDGAFLVRPSSSSSSGYVLCYIKNGRVKQVLIDQGGTRVKVCTSHTWYPSINKLCDAYSKPNNDKVLGLLLHPIPESTIAAMIMGGSPSPITNTAAVAKDDYDDGGDNVDGRVAVDGGGGGGGDDSDFLWGGGGNDYSTPEDIDIALQAPTHTHSHTHTRQQSNNDAEC